ncbi:Symplekin [Leucoagaricus sp. SymC.cos]|nr:Symplekin [Leucoagaricus sp. SymC.cos]
MANNPVDPLQLLQAALTAPENTPQQADLLASLRETLEHHPAPIPILVHTLIRKVTDAEDSLLKRWILDLLHFALRPSTLSIEQCTQMALQLLDPLAQLLGETDVHFVKVTIQCFTTVYPLLFRHLCINRSNPNPWHTLTACKNRIIDLVWSTVVNAGVRLSAMKFAQRVVLVQTRGVQDPRLQKPNDPNISFCPVDHPFISAARLEAEGQKLFEGLIATLYSSQDVDLLTALLNSWVALAKQRPSVLQTLIPALRSWTPVALEKLPAFSVKSVEKALRILLVHINRNCVPANSPLSMQITEILNAQTQRMEAAARDEKQRKASGIDGRKRAASTPAEQLSDAKRPKLESETSNTPNIASTLATFDFTSLPPPLITDLIVANLEAFTEPALESLVQQYRQQRGVGKIPPQASTSTPPTGTPTPSASALPPNVPTGPRRSVAQQAVERGSTPPSRATPPVVKVEEPVDPLQMDIDQDELEFEPETLNAQLGGDEPAVEEEQPTAELVFDGLQAIEFKLPPPRDLVEEDRIGLITSSVARIWTGADELPVDSLQAGGTSPNEVWMLLLVRMITRVAQPPADENLEEEEDSKEQVVHDFYVRQDQLRQKLCDYIMADFPSRVRLATTWMNEEWYNDQIRLERDNNWRPNYDIWLNQIVASYQTLLDGKDRTFSRFLLDLPAVPPDVLGLLRDLCVDESSDKVTIGFITLRGLVLQRPSLRTEALNILLELTTHPDKKTRAAAINVVKAWMSHIQPMDSMIREFALQMLRKLKLKSVKKLANGHVQAQDREGVADVTMEDASFPKENGIHVDEQDQMEEPSVVLDSEKSPTKEEAEETAEVNQPPEEDLVQTPYLPERIELPAQKAQVLQHVELLFALSVKSPEFLDQLFHAYGEMDITVQEAIQDLITALIKSLGPNNGKLLTLMRNFPSGADSLALRVLTIFTENGRASTTLVALVKALIGERDLDARFLIPIIAEMDRADIIRHLPRIVSILDGKAENRNIVRNVFNSIVATSTTFGSVSSNMPRVRHSELLPPDRLMVLLHQCEKEIGRKAAMEAISICFSMTDIFRSEVLGAVMQQLVDEPNLPILFLRTVIQAVTTYKSLVGFVSTTLLSRLITKKIWTNPPLWDGFIRCAKVTAPASFNALLQLPKDQLRELVDKQPSLKTSLRDYVTKKAPNKARLAGLLDIFGEAEDGTTPTPTPGSTEGSRTGSPAPA